MWEREKSKKTTAHSRVVSEAASSWCNLAYNVDYDRINTVFNVPQQHNLNLIKCTSAHDAIRGQWWWWRRWKLVVI